MTRLFIVTPSFNAARYIERTLMNIAAQAGEVEIHHHVQDGASDDGTREILARWAQLSAYKVLPEINKGYHFSWESVPDNGMYDAIAKGFARLDPSGMDWLTWLNADDLLMPGAIANLAEVDSDDSLADVNWITGQAALMVNDGLRSITEKKFTRSALAGGLCDGRWWDFLQAEGTFFRRRLWNQINPQKDFAAFKLAGDWNLWRLFATHDELYQLEVPTGVFIQREGQLSADQRSGYLAEIDEIVGTARRRMILRQLAAGTPSTKILNYDPETKRLRRKTASAQNHAKYWIEKAESDGLRVEVAATPRIVAHDADWQFPAITEQHAFNRVEESLFAAPGITYFAFPWATLIDQLNNKADKCEELLLALREKAIEALGAERIYTVCQHIHLDRLVPYMREVGITDVFWPHAVKRHPIIEGNPSIRIHPFPLYPVQFPEFAEEFDETDRPYLFSFIGARANQWYLTESRNWILDELGSDPRGLVRGRDTWFYNNIVYEHQIRGNAATDMPLIDEDAGAQFRKLLTDSTFSLCPSGSGPNSIRLWESMAAGSIPVILADTWLPPGNQALWDAAAVFCDETVDAIRELPDRLEAMAQDEELIRAKKSAVRQLFTLYGAKSFITDIQLKALSDGNAKCLSHRPSSSRIKVYLFGRHAIRTPLGTPAYRPYFEHEIEIVDSPDEADFLVVGFDLDLRQSGSNINALKELNPKLQLVVLSEEPLWDTIWSLGFDRKNTEITLSGVDHPLTVLNHFTSTIFDFEQIPYYVTTQDAFFARYHERFKSLAAESPETVLDRWRKAPISAAFFAEHRTDQRYAKSFPALDTEGLCVYRTKVAEAVKKDNVLRTGAGWGSSTGRGKLPDWHLDKLTQLDQSTHIISAIENTHQVTYVTEKIFDAYAYGALPAYYAAKEHRIFDLVPDGSFLNLHGMSPRAAANAISACEPSEEPRDAWIAGISNLSAVFSDPMHLFNERRRVADNVVKELRDLANEARYP